MSSRATATSERRSRLRFPAGWPAVFLLLCAAPVAIFLMLPWSLEGKALAVLQGLCAQQPTHTFYFGDSRLPFDARMTGIYGGFAMTSLYLLARRRWGKGGLPSLGVAAALGFFVMVMGIDGVNSTLLDMGQWYLYEPMNELRLVTGLLTGVSLAVFVWLLLGQVTMRTTDRTAEKVVTGFPDLAAILAILAIYTAVVMSGWEPLRVPLSALLIASAVGVLTGLSLAFVLLIGRRENRATSISHLAGPATAALLIAFTVMAVTSGGRYLLEVTYGLSTTTG